VNNELYLGPSVDVAQSNQLGAAALNILLGAPELGHEKKINASDSKDGCVRYSEGHSIKPAFG